MNYEKIINLIGALLTVVGAIFNIFHLAPFANYSVVMMLFGASFVVGSSILKNKRLEKQIKELQ